ncbi:hypothetical protein [Novosphingobium huizhouense]|uniref:hypothetical protein n=1 Tax=Novosphingobium huizhouense TaxID=2866625 RepID=UPI001CD8FB09|nr:hypothetical protein [Novosphingobium huizhouense]
MERVRLSGWIVPGAAGVALAGLAAAVLHTMLAFGPWYDEFFTFYVARPTMPLGQALVGHWLPDNHPPLYYALARGFWWIGDTIEHKRLLNLVLFAAALLGALVLVRPRADLHRLFALFAIALAAQGVVVRFAADYRSYFLSVCAIALLTVAVEVVHLGAAAPGGRPWRRRDGVVLWAAALVAFNSHITTTIVASAIQLPFLLRYLAARDFARFWRLGLPSLVAGLLFVAVSAVQARHWLANTSSFWLPPGLGVARWTIELLVLRVGQANLLLLGCAVAGFAAAGLALFRRSGAHDPEEISQIESAAFLLVGWALAVAAIVAIHLWRPFIYERYLLGLVPVMAMILALGAEALLRRLDARLAHACVALAAALSVAAAAQAALAKQQNGDWTPSAALVGRIVAACPDARVHTDPFWNAESITPPPADNRQVVPFAYRAMAARHGFALAPAGSRALSPRCPTLFWAAWTRPQDWPARDILARIRAQGFAVERIRVHRFARSFVAEADPQ